MSTRKPPSNIQAHLGFWLRKVSNAVSQSFARKMEAEGVTVAEWVFLRALFDVERIAPSVLAERMGMTRGAISKLADRLVDKNLVERKSNPGDRRAHTLGLAPAGRALVPKLAAHADENDETFFGSLTSAERQRLEELLRKIALQRDLTHAPVD